MGCNCHKASILNAGTVDSGEPDGDDSAPEIDLVPGVSAGSFTPFVRYVTMTTRAADPQAVRGLATGRFYLFSRETRTLAVDSKDAPFLLQQGFRISPHARHEEGG
jgi:hypothetical protein